jgi:hypothetical protein
MACIVINPVVSSDPYCIVAQRGQVFRLRTTRTKTIDEIADATDLDEWTPRLDDDAAGDPVGAAPIRTWTGTGSTDVGEFTEVPLPFNQIFSFAGNKTLPFKVVDMTAENIAAAKLIRKAGSVAVRFWVEAGTLLYTGDAGTGIIGRMTADIVIPEGSADLQYIQLNFTFSGGLGTAVANPFPLPVF